MRGKWVLWLGGCLLWGMAALSPLAVRAAIPSASYIQAAVRDYAAVISGSGVLEQQGKKQVFLSTPVIAQNILVSPGDEVKEGEPLALIDTELTRSVLSHSVVLQRPASEETGALLELQKLEQAAALYGVSMEELLPLLETDTALSESSGSRETVVAIPTEILAPMDGVVTDVAIESGVLTQASGAVFTVADRARFGVRMAVGESQIASIALGDTAEITGLAFDGAYHGVVESIAPAAKRTGETAQATVEVQIRVLDPDERLRENYSTSVTITSQTSERMLTLPYEAIRQDADNIEYVFVYENGRAKKQPVTTGKELANCVQIISGLNGSECVLTGEGLQEGKRIRLGEEGML
ncbi:MAG: efflux RND transporter periplasmic adaptor subunit [Provencibacterium sp.]|jgi:RND family efflux transporter MFP subunit|nr:efflux RND transporter periplasmic adaptor subunit [Provencibacterium sp.]